jgi:hypothetical protein
MLMHRLVIPTRHRIKMQEMSNLHPINVALITDSSLSKTTACCAVCELSSHAQAPTFFMMSDEWFF